MNYMALVRNCLIREFWTKYYISYRIIYNSKIKQSAKDIGHFQSKKTTPPIRPKFYKT